MKFDFNWGWGIFSVYSMFALALFFQVYKSTQYDNSLVVDEYYKEDLRYQQQYDRLANTQRLDQALYVAYEKQSGQLTLLFPADTPRPVGTITCYRPDNKRLDRVLAIVTDSQGHMQTEALDLLPGRWTIKVNWDSGTKGYYHEEIISVPL